MYDVDLEFRLWLNVSLDIKSMSPSSFASLICDVNHAVKLRYNGLLGIVQKRLLYQRSIVSEVGHGCLTRHTV